LKFRICNHKSLQFNLLHPPLWISKAAPADPYNLEFPCIFNYAFVNFFFWVCWRHENLYKLLKQFRGPNFIPQHRALGLRFWLRSTLRYLIIVYFLRNLQSFILLICHTFSEYIFRNSENLNHYFHLHVCASICSFVTSVTLQRFIPLIASEAPTVLVPGAPEPRIYPCSG